MLHGVHADPGHLGLTNGLAWLQALTKGGQVLQDFLAAHPDMRATIPVLLASLRNMQ